MYPHASSDETMRIREAFKKRKKSVDFFHTSWTPSPPESVETHLRGKNFLQFYPENDLPTHKKLDEIGQNS